MLLFTQAGRCYWLKVYEIPEGSRASKGRAIQNVLSIPDDKILAYINVKTLKDPEYVNGNNIVLITKRGYHQEDIPGGIFTSKDSRRERGQPA